MKMNILVQDYVPLGFAMVAGAHASLACYLRFKDKSELTWLNGPFFKAVCNTERKRFENAKAVSSHVLLTESKLQIREVAIAFYQRHEWPKMFRFLKLYRYSPEGSGLYAAVGG